MPETILQRWTNLFGAEGGGNNSPDSLAARVNGTDGNGANEENAANDPTINKVYQSYKNFHEEVSAYHAISEDAFIEARNN